MGFDWIKQQMCVHWARTGTNVNGRPTWADPVERSCRWEGRNEKYTALNGEELMSRALVYVDGVAVGDVLMLGTMEASGFISADPLRNQGAWEVRRYDSMPDIDNSEVLYTAYL